MAKRIRITRIIAQTGEMAQQLQGMHFSQFKPPAGGWQPEVNAYAYDDRFEFCVSLSGVNQDDIDLAVTARQLSIRGVRRQPRPCEEDSSCRQILMMEIESGPFETHLQLSRDVDPERLVARQTNGMLWITLYYTKPLKDYA